MRLHLLLEPVQHCVARQHLRHAGFKFAAPADGGEEYAILQLDTVYRHVHLRHVYGMSARPYG